MKLKFLYLLHRLSGVAIVDDFDVMNNIVVCAPNTEDARLEASKHHGDEGSYIWLADCFSNITAIGLAAEEVELGLICRDFRAG